MSKMLQVQVLVQDQAGGNYVCFLIWQAPCAEEAQHKKINVVWFYVIFLRQCVNYLACRHILCVETKLLFSNHSFSKHMVKNVIE